MLNGRAWQLETLIPLVILAGFLCDAAGRFVRIEPLTFRAEEGLMQFRSYPLPGPYETDRHVHSDRITGDLANIGNLPDYAVAREQTFTTDALGFRNDREPGAAAPDVVIIGSSFTLGSGSSDSQMLSSRLAALSGCRTYNAANFYGWTSEIPKFARRLGMRDGMIILECLDHSVENPLPPEQESARMLEWLPYRDELKGIRQTMSLRLSISPLKILFQRTYKSLQNDRVLPNIHKSRVVVRQLRDGQPSLFLPPDENPRRHTAVPPLADFYVRLRDRFRAAGFDLAVVIVPEKMTVYGSLLREATPEGSEDRAILAEVEGALRERGIPVVNLAPILADAARRALDDHRTIYWADDTHWNPEGIEIAAKAIHDGLGLGAWCERRHARSAP